MDKRSIVFLVALTAAFFIINNFLFPPSEYSPPPFKTEETPSQPLPSSSPVINQTGDLYVIESPYQQLVVSTLGGTLSEINLVLNTDKNPQSVVRPIRVDRVLEKSYPDKDNFPLLAYQSSEGKKTPQLGGYYPLLRRSTPVANQALALSSPEDPSLSQLKYRVTKLEKNRIELEASGACGTVRKTIAFPEDPTKAPYCFDVKVELESKLHHVTLSSGVPEVELVSGSSSPVLKYRITKNAKAVVEQLDLPKTLSPFDSIHPDWLCNSNGFLGVILDGKDKIRAGFQTAQIPGDIAPTRLSYIDAENSLYPADKYPGYEILLPLLTSGKELNFRLYAGPFAKEVLSKVDATYTDKSTRYNPDYTSCISFHGWFSFISEPFAKFLFFLMEIFHFLTRSWGLSIILLTLALRLMLYPLNAWSIRSTAKMQTISPRVAQIQEKHKKDPKKAQMEILNLYKQQGVNPLGGCLPLLIQMPFLIGMFDLLKSTFELRGAPFIPGWIDNLTAPDVVFSWNYPIWFFGTSFHLLPFLLGAVMYWQQKLSSKMPKDKALLTDQQKQQQFMGNMMVIVFTLMFYNFPSGLNIYWLSSMLLGILQQWWMNKKVKA